jgi:hypothetical protein
MRGQVRSKIESMKTLFRTDKYVLMALGIVGSAVIISCVHNQTGGARTGKVEIKYAAIVLHPGTKLRPDDARAMDEILAKSDKNLYKIATAENGRINRKGTLPDVHMTKEFRAEVADAEIKGTSNRHHQVYCDPCATHFLPSSKMADQKKLIAELTPILAKYQ